MKEKEVVQLGFARGAAASAAMAAAQAAAQQGMKAREIRKTLRLIARNPAPFRQHPQFGALAALLVGSAAPAPVPVASGTGAPWRQWGRDIDPESIEQMRNACALPVSVRGALMPDAHVGYGLPIGGVIAVRNAVIPYAVGVDIACRMKITAFDLPPETLQDEPERFKRAIEAETRFGVGAEFKTRRRHEVMDMDWGVSPVTRMHKDKAWAQLGTSGSGNHFVEFGVLDVFDTGLSVAPGRYLALMSHSGSRGTGALVCEHYSKVAMQQCRDLPPALRRLAWLALDRHEGREYWAAMQLMGRYAAANHALIHRSIARHLGAQALLDIENHHNFAWREEHDGELLIVHRKGATPAGEGVIGIIPGSMASPAYIVRGLGHPESLRSAAHGAGRRISRTQAKKTLHWRDACAMLDAQGVTIMSAGLDEVPMVYKDIEEVMAAQAELVAPIARFHPKLVKMAPAGERPED